MPSRIEREKAAIRRRLKVYRKALDDAVASGVSSATLSSGGSSQSYTRMSVSDLEKAIAVLERDLARLTAGPFRRVAPNFV